MDQCPIKNLKNGRVVLHNKTSPGQVASYYCFKGYLLEGENLRQCLVDGEWSGTSPRCMRKY